MSPCFILSTSSCSCGDMSARANGPMRPPFALDGESETSPASLAKSSPLSARARASWIFFCASSSFATLTPPSDAATSTKISRSVTDAESVNCSGYTRVVLARFFLGDIQLRSDFLALDLLDQHLLLELLAQIVDGHALLRERRLELGLVLELVLLADVGDDLNGTGRRRAEAHLAAALQQQQLVDGVRRSASA